MEQMLLSLRDWATLLKAVKQLSQVLTADQILGLNENPVGFSPQLSLRPPLPLGVLFFFWSFSRAAPMAYGGSQARGLIGALAAGLGQSPSNAAASATYTTAHGNTRSLTH